MRLFWASDEKIGMFIRISNNELNVCEYSVNCIVKIDCNIEKSLLGADVIVANVDYDKGGMRWEISQVAEVDCFHFKLNSYAY